MELKPILEDVINDLQNSDEKYADKELILKLLGLDWPYFLPIFEHLSDELKDDKDFVIEALTKDYNLVEFISVRLQNDFNVIEKAIKEFTIYSDDPNDNPLFFASDRIKSDELIICDLLEISESCILYCDQNIRNKFNDQFEFAEKLLIINPHILQFWDHKINKEFVKRLFLNTEVSSFGYILKYISDELKNDKEIVLMAVSSNGFSLEYAPNHFLNDKEITLNAIRKNGAVLSFVSDEFKNDIEIVKAALKTNGTFLQFASENLRDNEDIAIEAINNNPEAFEFVSDRLKNEENIAIIALEKVPRMLEYASVSLKDQKDLVLKALNISTFPWHVWDFASENLKNDLDVALLAVSKNGNILKDLNSKLRDNRLIVSAAVAEDGNSLEYASDNLRGDLEIVEIAIKTAPKDYFEDSIIPNYAIKFISESLRMNRGLVLSSIFKNGGILEYLNDNFKDDEEIVSKAVKEDPLSIAFASDRLKNDKNIALQIVGIWGHALKFISESLKDDFDVVLEAVKNDINYSYNPPWETTDLNLPKPFIYPKFKHVTLEFASDRLKNNSDIVMAAVKKNGISLQFASLELKSNFEIVMESVRQNGFSLNYVSDEFKSNPKIVLEALTQNFNALGFANEILLDSKDFILKAISINYKCLGFTNKLFYYDKDFMLKCVKINGFCLQFMRIIDDFELAKAAYECSPEILSFLPIEMQNKLN